MHPIFLDILNNLGLTASLMACRCGVDVFVGLCSCSASGLRMDLLVWMHVLGAGCNATSKRLRVRSARQEVHGKCTEERKKTRMRQIRANTGGYITFYIAYVR